MVRALASHQCVPGSIPGPSVICGLSLLLVLSLLREVFLRVLRSSSHPLPPPPPMWPGFDSRTRRHVWVEFVDGSLLTPRGFSPGTPVFLPPPPPPLPHQCGPGSIPGPSVIYGLSLLLVLSLLREVFLRVLRSSSHPLPPSPTNVARVRFPDPASYVG